MQTIVARWTDWWLTPRHLHSPRVGMLLLGFGFAIWTLMVLCWAWWYLIERPMARQQARDREAERARLDAPLTDEERAIRADL